MIVTPDVRGEELSTSASVVKVTQEMDSDAHVSKLEIRSESFTGIAHIPVLMQAVNKYLLVFICSYWR